MKYVQAKTIFEMANAPVTPEADDYFHKKKVDVIPDILANAGGVVVSYFEWVQNRNSHYWTEDDVNKKLAIAMQEAFSSIYEKVQEDTCTFRKAAYMLAVSRILDAERARGNLVEKKKLRFRKGVKVKKKIAKKTSRKIGKVIKAPSQRSPKKRKTTSK